MYVKVRKRGWVSGGEKKQAWIVDYKDANGRRHIETFQRKKDADIRKSAIEAELTGGSHVPRRESVTVGEASALWLQSRENGDAHSPAVEASTLRSYRQHVSAYIEPRLGAVKLSDLTESMVRRFANQMVQERTRVRARKVLTSLKSILEYATREGLAGRNVAKSVKVAKDERAGEGVEVDVEKIPGRTDMRGIFAGLDEKATSKEWRRYRAIIKTAILTGMRASELRGLPWQNVDLKASTIKVRQRADEKGTIGPPKSKAGVRDIFIPPSLVVLLREWKIECPPGPHDLVFPNWQGNVESLSNIHKRGWNPILKACGLPHYRFHDIRHYRASVLIADGANAKEVQTELGHANIAITLNLYAKLLKEDDGQRRERAARLAADLV